MVVLHHCKAVSFDSVGTANASVTEVQNIQNANEKNTKAKLYYKGNQILFLYPRS